MVRRSPFVALMLLLGVLFHDPLMAQAGEGEGYTYRIETAADFQKFSAPEQFLPSVERSLKFLAPAAEDDKLLPTLFQNVNLYQFHQEFLRQEFAERFPGIDTEEYLSLIERRATRSYFAGIIYRFKGNPDPKYGFDIFTVANSVEELPFQEEIRWIYGLLKETFKLGPLEYSPRRTDAIQNAQSWTDFDVPINFAFGGGLPDYIAYTQAENYGRMRVLTFDEFTEANESGAISFQDILVLPVVPTDIEGVIAGVITGEIQGELGHLAIRTARRGTPNAYVRNATTVCASYHGKLVHLKIESIGYTISEATLPEAEAFWETHRPKTPDIVEVDPDYKSLDSTADILVTDANYPDQLRKYGAKATNQAILFHLLTPEHRIPAFAVPYYYYIQFMQSNKTSSAIDPSRKVTLQEYIEELIADPTFRGDSKRRSEALARFRELIRRADVDPEVVQAVARRIVEIFKIPDEYVRFRSSSNVEHLLEFNGAGLHESTSGCAADDLDAEVDGPSLCEPGEQDEHGVTRALKVVWASLWNFRAFEEREYYRISQLRGRMAILVSQAFTLRTEELVNGVAFTGNLDVRGDRRFLVTSQLGDTPVVSPPPGVVAEKDLLEMENGQVANIIRVRPSNIVGAGELLLSDARLREIGAVMADVEKRYPVGLGGHDAQDVLIDLEFKIDIDNNLRFKDVRQFLIASTGTASPQYTLKVPPNLVVCGSFFEGRSAKEIYQTKAQIGLREGDHLLRTDGPSSANLIEWVQLGPNAPQIPAAAAGVWDVTLHADRTDPVFECNMSQKFVLPDNSSLWVGVVNFNITVTGPREIPLDADAVTWSINPYIMHLGMNYGPEPRFKEDFNHKWFLPCNLDHLPLFFVDVLFTNGDSAHFFERFQDVRDGTGPAELAAATVSLGGTDISINDYWRLVYTAGHHNENPRPEHWAIFDEVLDLPGVGRVKGLGVSEGFAGTKKRAFYLGEDLSELKPLEIGTFRRRKEGDPLKSEFRRGDVDMSGKVNLTDAILILRYNFYGDTISCVDAGDVDDIGTAGVDDAILLLGYLFFGLDAPNAPGPDHCGEDVEADELPDCEPGACR